jgi:hypothetical protein
MPAMILSLPPQRAQPSISMSNARFGRRAQSTATCRGVGTSAASRAIRSSGSSTMCVVPSRYGVFSVQRTWPEAVSARRSLATGGATDPAAQPIQLLAPVRGDVHAGMQWDARPGRPVRGLAGHGGAGVVQRCSQLSTVRCHFTEFCGFRIQ